MLLAEIFMLRMETATREAATEATTSSRFVPVTLTPAGPVDDTPEPLYPPLVRAALQSSLRAFEKHRRLIVSQTDGEALILQRASVSRRSGQWRDDD